MRFPAVGCPFSGAPWGGVRGCAPAATFLLRGFAFSRSVRLAFPVSVTRRRVLRPRRKTFTPTLFRTVGHSPTASTAWHSHARKEHAACRRPLYVMPAEPSALHAVHRASSRRVPKALPLRD